MRGAISRAGGRVSVTPGVSFTSSGRVSGSSSG
jgi:hypothetical protein